MSLLDSILLEAHRDPRDVWVAARADAQRGSGTIDDPFDGGTRIDASISGSAAFDILEVLAAVGAEHNYLTGDTIIISGIDGRDAVPFNGTFTINAPTQRHFTFHLARAPKAPPSNYPVPTAQRLINGTLNHAMPLTADMEVTINTSAVHRLPNGTFITINGITGGGAPKFNGRFAIHGVVDPATSTSFKFNVSGTPDASADGQSVTCTTDSISFRPNWPVGKVTTISEHGYGDFDVVKVEDAAAPGTLPAILARTVVIIGANPASTIFWYRLLNPNPPDVAIPAAVSGSYSVHCSCVRFRFDEVMRGLPENTPVMVHVAAGTFETRGSCVAYIKDANNGPNSVYAGFQIQQGNAANTLSTKLLRPGLGMRISGAGMEATILSLVYAVDGTSQTCVLANLSENPTVNFEASGFTIDCNLSGQPVPAGFQYAPVSVAGIQLSGRLIRIQRIRTINAGPQGLAESFMALISSHYLDAQGAFHNVLEDCVVEKPAESNSRETTLLGIVGDKVFGNSRAGVVRHCFANMQYSNGALPRLLPVEDLHRDSSDRTLAWLTTIEPHSHTKGKGLVVRGALAGGSLSNAFNGTFAIESIVSETELTYRMHADPAPGESGEIDATGVITIGHGISREQLGVKSLRIDSTEGYVLTDTFLDDGILGFMAAGIAETDADVDPFCLTPVDLDAAFSLVTKRPHNRTRNHRIQLFNVAYAAEVPTGTPPFNGAYPVLAVDSTGDTLLPDRLIARLPADTPFVGRLVALSAGMGADFHTLVAANGTGCVTEGNAVYDTQSPLYLDTGTSRDLIIRDNYWSDCSFGVTMNFGPGFDASGSTDLPRTALSLKRDAIDPTLAIFETDSETRFTFLQAGQAVTIRNARVDEVPPTEPPSKYYNGTFSVLSVDATGSTYVFKYRMPQDPMHDADSSSDPAKNPSFSTRWQTLRLSLESNVMEEYPIDLNTYYSTVGVSAYGYPADVSDDVVQPAPYMFPQMVIRENTIRHRDELSDTPGIWAIGVTSVEKALIEGNILTQQVPYSILYSFSKSIHTLSNRTPSGDVFHPYEGFGNLKLRDDLERMIEDTTLFAL